MAAKATLLKTPVNIAVKSARQRDSFIRKIVASGSLVEAKSYLMSAAKSRSMTLPDYSAVSNAYRDKWVTGQLWLFPTA